MSGCVYGTSYSPGKAIREWNVYQSTADAQLVYGAGLPLTIVPLYIVAYAYGKAILGQSGPDGPIAPFQWDWTLHTFWQWMLSLGKPLGIGLIALALTLAVVGYFATALAWRAYVTSAWRRRTAKRQRRSPSA